jgi:hypothetical protein
VMIIAAEAGVPGHTTFSWLSDSTTVALTSYPEAKRLAIDTVGVLAAGADWANADCEKIPANPRNISARKFIFVSMGFEFVTGTLSDAVAIHSSKGGAAKPDAGVDRGNVSVSVLEISEHMTAVQALLDEHLAGGKYPPAIGTPGNPEAAINMLLNRIGDAVCWFKTISSLQ